MSWLRIRELIRKEFIQLFRDKRNRPLLIIAPLAQLILFGYVVTTDVRDIRFAALDYSHTPESRELIRKIDAAPVFRKTRTASHPQELDRLLLKRHIDLAVVIPPDYGPRVQKGLTTDIQILVDGSMSNMAGVRIAYTTTLLDNYNFQWLKERLGRQMDYGEIDARVRTWYNSNLDSQHFYVPGIVAFLVMLLSLLFTSMAIVREKEAGTIEQLIVTPLRPIEMIMGKTIPFIIIAQLQMIAVIAFARFWFKIPMAGSIALMMIATCLFLLSTLGIGLLISTVSKTQQQAMMTNFFFILPFFMLSGFVFPIANMPIFVQGLTYLNPLRYFLVIIRGIFLKGTGFAVLWPQMLGLTLLGLVVFTAAVIRFGKRLD
jgi:ABC-2 type transport system permease protein